MTQLSDLLWATTPSSFANIERVIARHLAGEVADIAAIESKLGKPLNSSQPQLEIERGVATITLEGVLAKKANMLMQISGGTSTQIAGQQFAQALADPSVTSIVLAIDSPGGTVDGTQALADQIYAARGKKPIIAVADGLCASAAYWIGSAADKVYIAGDTVATGSLGVIATHVDTTVADAQRGQVKTTVRSAALKAIPDDSKLTETGLGVLQGMVDRMHGVFAAAVGRNRGLSGSALKNVSTGAIFLGSEAVDNGLVDGVQSLEQTVAALQRTVRAQGSTIKATATAPRILSVGDTTIALQKYIAAQLALGNKVSRQEAQQYLRSLT